MSDCWMLKVSDDMASKKNEDIVRDLFWGLVGRRPTDDQITAMAADMARSPDSLLSMIESMHQSKEATDYRKSRDSISMLVPPGHYYSPIVDPSSLDRGYNNNSMAGLNFNPDAMLGFFKTLSPHFGSPSFPETEETGKRYYRNNDFYGPGDATVLSAMITHFTPSRMIEVGSGFSSAVMLDTADFAELDTQFTFIDPYPHRLEALFTKVDKKRCTIIADFIQNVPLETFDALDDGDILFLDTTHVSKTGSDVNHEVFEILPRLNKGVVVHFHDFFDNFEYPDNWVYDHNRSWNEQYIVRAFLMQNPNFEILMLNDTIAQRFRDEATELSPAFMQNPGGGLWLRKTG
ncbi:MAG: class I SAM-dependent methyltransferase [Pseudomonadota bacterium]